jgi:hypothetical protein
MCPAIKGSSAIFYAHLLARNANLQIQGILFYLQLRLRCTTYLSEVFQGACKAMDALGKLMTDLLKYDIVCECMQALVVIFYVPAIN